jgi:protein transport protein SEC23
VTAESVPAEVMQAYQAIEYKLQTPQNRQPPVIVFVIDACVAPAEFAALKASLAWALDVLPRNAVVGLVVYGTTVQIHELTYEHCPRSYIFRGHHEFAPAAVEEMLGLRASAVGAARQQQVASQRVLMPLSECEMELTQIIDDLQADPWEIPAKKRPWRCTGAALGAAASLVGSLFPDRPARIVLLAGGPPTLGPGTVVSTDLLETIRSHTDIEKKESNAANVKTASKTYEALAHRCAAKGHAVDVFSCAYDQVGVMEMRSLADATGGEIVLTESFTHHVFQNSWRSLFAELSADATGAAEEPPLRFGYNGVLEVATNADVKVAGVLGPCHPLPANPMLLDNVGAEPIGKSGTNSFRLSALSSVTTLAVFLDIDADASRPVASGSQRYVQFRLRYHTSSGDLVLRVVTCAFHFVHSSDVHHIAGGFDQEAAAVVVAKLAAHKADSGEKLHEVSRGIDKAIIRVASRFARYQKGDATSFAFLPNFELFPQYLYHFRRSPFMHLFGTSPDETAFFRFCLLKETVLNALTMMQPVLVAYSLERPEPMPVVLDSSSATPDRILVLDSYFHLLVWHGETIASWRKEGYADREEYANLKALLQAPKADAADVAVDRFPCPKYTECDQHGSQARLLLSRLNPSKTHKTAAPMYGASAPVDAGEVIATDDVSLQNFLAHLKKVVVEQAK